MTEERRFSSSFVIPNRVRDPSLRIILVRTNAKRNPSFVRITNKEGVR